MLKALSIILWNLKLLYGLNLKKSNPVNDLFPEISNPP